MTRTTPKTTLTTNTHEHKQKKNAFDFRSNVFDLGHALRGQNIFLKSTLGLNSAVFDLGHALRGQKNTEIPTLGLTSVVFDFGHALQGQKI